MLCCSACTAFCRVLFHLVQKPVQFVTNTAKTGIVVDALPAKSNIQVSLTANEDGEGYPLVYVLICQRVLGN